MRHGPVVGSSPRSGIPHHRSHHAGAGGHIRGPTGTQVHLTALLFFILSSQKWVVWTWTGDCWLELRVWVFPDHIYAFPAFHEELPFSPWSLTWLKSPRVTFICLSPVSWEVSMWSVPMWLLAKFGVTLSADMLLVEGDCSWPLGGQLRQVSLLCVLTVIVTSSAGLGTACRVTRGTQQNNLPPHLLCPLTADLFVGSSHFPKIYWLLNPSWLAWMGGDASTNPSVPAHFISYIY